MASVKYLLQSKSDNANIYVQFSINRKQVFKRKTGFIIDAKDWNGKAPIQKSQELKTLKSKLDKLTIFVNDAYNTSISEGIEFTGDWLQFQIDLYNNKTPVASLDVFTTYIQKYIDDAPYKQNAKKELGLSKGRVQNLKLFKSTVLKYEAEKFNNKSILIRDINLKFVEQYKAWMFGENYSTNYVGKNIANIRTICIDAAKNDIETSSQIKNIKGLSESKEPEDIVFLSEEEQDSIKNAPIFREALINARKWLMLGCLIGQRAGDLLSITSKNIKEIGDIKIIELKQQKTGKLVAIPLLPEAIEIIESGMPYKVSLVHFNKHIKDVCQAAGIDKPTRGREKLKNNVATKKGLFPKYKVVSSHICRRSFATNYYGRIPTPILMNITAHGTEKMFLTYIGKTTYDNAYQMLEYFSKLKPREREMCLWM